MAIKPSTRVPNKVLLLEFVIATVIRLILTSSSYRQEIADRVEISTLLNSWKRVTEGVCLYQEGINPYDGDIFHETPMALIIFDFMINQIPYLISTVFILCDLFTAFILYKTAVAFMEEMEEKQKKEITEYAEGISNLLLSQNDFDLAPVYVMSVYLFNPFSILSCVGYTTTTFGNLCLSLVFLGMVKGFRFVSCLALGLAVVQSFYPVILLVPLCMYLSRNDSNKILSIIKTISLFIIITTTLLFISYLIVKDWKFLQSIYLVILTVPDLRPNIGLFWYFFTEMFEHFRILFIFSFQLNATLLYLAPLSLRFHSNPMLLATSLIALVTVFKSYPSLGDVGFYLSLLPMWKHLYKNMQQSFIIACSMVVTSVLGPTVWHLWIYSRSANANFYFGVTLAFATSQIFLITDLLFSYIKRDFSLRHGIVDVDEQIKLKLLLE